jgi:uncharacterized protein involved in exopolysaccharide biosynthesis
MSSEHEVNIFDIVKLVLSHKKYIVASIFICMILSLYIFLSEEKKYVSSITFMNLNSAKESKAMQFGQISQMMGLSLPTSSSGSLEKNVLGIIKSRTLGEKVIENIEKTLSSSTKYKNEKYKIPNVGYLINRIKVQKVKNSQGSFRLTVTWSSPELTSLIANEYIKTLKTYLKENALTSNQKTHVFITEQLNKVNENLDKAENNLTNFYLKHKIFDVRDQAKIITDSIGNIREKISSTEVEIEALKQIKSTSAPEIISKKALLVALKNKDKELNQGSLSNKNIISLKDIPQLSLIQERFVREVFVQQGLLKNFRTQLERIKIHVEKETNIIWVLDKALTPSSPSNPNLTIKLVLGAMVGLAFAIFLIFAKDFIGRYNKIQNT